MAEFSLIIAMLCKASLTVSKCRDWASNRVKVSFLLMAMASWLYWLWVMGELAKAIAITLGRIRAKAR